MDHLWLEQLCEHTHRGYDPVAGALNSGCGTYVVKTNQELGYMVPSPWPRQFTAVKRCQVTKFVEMLREGERLYREQFSMEPEPIPALPYGFVLWTKSVSGLQKAADWTSTEKEVVACLRVGNHVHTGLQDDEGLYPWVLTHLYDLSYVTDWYSADEAINEAERLHWLFTQ